MCEISNSSVQRFQSWYFPDKPYSKSITLVLVLLRLNIPVKKIFCHVGTEPPLPG